MTDYPPEALAAAALTLHQWTCTRQDDPDHDCTAAAAWPPNEAKAAAILDAAAPVLAEANAQAIANLRREIDHMRQVLERKNRQLDALHLVWCDGGCPGGVHRYQDEDVLVTEELVAAAERNTERLRHWYEAVKFRHETYGPDPRDPSRQFPSTASEWHRQYAARAAARTDLAGRSIPEVPGAGGGVMVHEAECTEGTAET